MRRIILVSAFLLSGCATSLRQADSVVGTNQPIEYREGYAEGCDTGTSAAGNPYYHFRKDVNSYRIDALYKQGWDDGFNICKGQYDSINVLMSGSRL